MLYKSTNAYNRIYTYNYVCLSPVKNQTDWIDSEM